MWTGRLFGRSCQLYYNVCNKSWLSRTADVYKPVCVMSLTPQCVCTHFHCHLSVCVYVCVRERERLCVGEWDSVCVDEWDSV